MKDEVDQAAVRLLHLLDYAILPGYCLSACLYDVCVCHYLLACKHVEQGAVLLSVFVCLFAPAVVVCFLTGC